MQSWLQSPQQLFGYKFRVSVFTCLRRKLQSSRCLTRSRPKLPREVGETCPKCWRVYSEQRPRRHCPWRWIWFRDAQIYALPLVWARRSFWRSHATSSCYAPSGCIPLKLRLQSKSAKTNISGEISEGLCFTNAVVAWHHIAFFQQQNLDCLPPRSAGRTSLLPATQNHAFT